MNTPVQIDQVEATSPVRRSSRRAEVAPLRRQLLAAVPQALRKLDPRLLWRNPVMFIVELGSVVATLGAIARPTLFVISIAVWLWLTVIFGNLAEAVAESRGKAQAATPACDPDRHPGAQSQLRRHRADPCHPAGGR